MLDDKRFAKTQVKDITQNIILENRKKLSISGVEDVDSFDEDVIVLYTQIGTLTIKGEDLHINKLSIETGEVTVEGDIMSLIYSDDEPGRGHSGGFISRLFK